MNIKDLCLDISGYFWLLWGSKYNYNIATDKLNEIYSALLQQYIEKHGVIDKAA